MLSEELRSAEVRTGLRRWVGESPQAPLEKLRELSPVAVAGERVLQGKGAELVPEERGVLSGGGLGE